MKPLSSEQKRILVAAADGRLSFDNRTYRYRIEGGDPPNRREREKLQKRGLLTRPGNGNAMFTEKGLVALTDAPVTDSPPPDPEQIALPLPAAFSP